MKIPKCFKLMGRTIDVEWSDRLLNDDSNQGEAQYRNNKIVLQRPSTSHPMPNLEQTFCHELVHWLIYFSGAANTGKHDYLHQEESFIDLTADLLHQALTTMEYSTPEPDPNILQWVQERRELDQAKGALLLLVDDGVITSGRMRELLGMDIWRQREEHRRILGAQDA